MASNERWWRNDRDRGGWPGGERDVRDLGPHRDYGRDMLDDMRRYAHGGRGWEDRGRENRFSDYGPGGYDRNVHDREYRGRGDYGRMDDGRPEYGRSGYGRADYGRGGHYGGSEPDDRGFLERAGDEMASWFGDDDAESRRRLDAWRGDRGAQHHRGRGPRGYSRSDERIREDVNDRLTDDPYVDASDIDVVVSGGEVTLSGTVDDRRSKHRAEDIAESIPGIRHVQNNLRVRTTMGGTMAEGTAGTMGASATPATGSSRTGDDTRTTGVVGNMNAPATLHTVDTDSTTRR